MEESESEGEGGGFDVKLLFSVLEKLKMVLGLVHLDRFEELGSNMC